LLHELAHAGQGDTQLNAAASLAQSLWFFLPHLWWLRAQLRIDQEFVADQKTALAVGSSAGYATRLVALAARSEGTPSLRPIAESIPLLSGWWWDGGFKTPLLQRVVMLLHAPFPIETRATRLWSSIAPTLLLVLAVLISSLSLFAVPGSPVEGSVAVPPNGNPAVFQVSQFVASPQVLRPSGRSAAYVLPLQLPPQFDLSVEIEAPRSTLAHMRLAGYSLACPPPEPASTLPGRDDQAAREDPSVRHRIRLRRNSGFVSLQIDNQVITVVRSQEGPYDWLTIEPSPDQTAIIHNLTVTW
jgi:hypothetical protein